MKTLTRPTVLPNPILRGFNPDPSICRAGEDVYIATSTFEWFPGVQIHHSRNFKDWTLAARPLSERRLLDMRGNPDSGGVWAPALSHADGLFWLVYTDMKRRVGNYKDAHNYLVTAEAIEGSWSEPVYLGAGAFDPSLFHDDDGRKWLLTAVWDHRDTRNPFSGIRLQEYDAARRQLTGAPQIIFKGTSRGLTEGPHLIKKDGWYYLVVAEGGTGYDHAVTHARSRTIAGPYEVHPDIHPIHGTTTDQLHRSGHGQIVELDDGTVWHTHLCSRSIGTDSFSLLGRETALQRCEWGEDGWLRVLEVSGDTLSETPKSETKSANFADGLPSEMQWLRTPHAERLFSTSARPGLLRLFGREGLGSHFEQSLVARRVTEFFFTAEATLEFQPETYQQSAGLVLYYSSTQFLYLRISNEAGARSLSVAKCEAAHDTGEIIFGEPTRLPPDGPVSLKVDFQGMEAQFFWASDGAWNAHGAPIDASFLCDEKGKGRFGGYAGTFVGVFAEDLTGFGHPADVSRFEYRCEEARF